MSGRLLRLATVVITHPTAAGYTILVTLRELARDLQVDVIVTSGEDGTHSGPFDPHKLGSAYDIRSHAYQPVFKAMFFQQLQSRLGPRFYALWEAPGQPNEHFHVQLAQHTLFTVGDIFAEPSLTV